MLFRSLDNGTSLCRLGFPFNDVTPTYDGTSFAIPPQAFPMPFFPNDGILTRFVIVSQSSVGYDVGFLETSSPGLRGQSGGPIFDREGTVWSIQSQTRHLPLGFSPPVPNGKKNEVEHQFLNVGWGTHPATIAGLLSECGISYELSNY